MGSSAGLRHILLGLISSARCNGWRSGLLFEAKTQETQYSWPPSFPPPTGYWLQTTPGEPFAVAFRLPDARVVLIILPATVLFLLLPVWGWGSWSGLISHPARAGAVVVVVLASVVFLFTPANLGSIKLSRTRNILLIIPGVLFIVAQAWLPAYADSRDLWTLDGDATRCVGLALLVVGCVLRIGPVFVLGGRFRPPLATQDEHRLVTTGFYRYICNPSYLGALLGGAGWLLVFRCLAGLALIVLLVALCIRLLPAEEAMLLSEFGDEYAEYKKRTWRLIPFVY
jgi:protein-S-isoprenylcysteine O-methyltransferase Ste14